MTNLSAEALYHTLQSFLRADLHALYRYPAPSASSPTQDGERWLLVVSSFHYLHDIRVFLRSDSADFPPIAVATPPLLKRYCHTDPIFADQLRQGTTIGTPLSSELIRPASAELNYAYCAHLWLQISPLLTVDSAELYTPYQKLCYLLSLPPHTPLLDLLATLQAQLPKMQLPTATSPALSQSLPTLQAIYNDLDSALLVIDDEVEALAGVNWGNVLAEHGKQSDRLQLTTITQLRFVAVHELPLAFGIGRYRLRAGTNYLADLPLTIPLLLENAQRILLELLIEYLPNRYFNSADDDLNLFIHDLQNQLLKTQLQYDLLCILHQLKRHTMPRFNHERNRSSAMRITDIITHIEHWLTLYS